MSLLLLGAVSVNQTLHNLLHANGASDDGVCLVCSLAKGQITTSQVAAVFCLFAFWLLLVQGTPRRWPRLAPDVRSCPNRAPPVR